MLMNLACHYLNYSQYRHFARPSIELGITTVLLVRGPLALPTEIHCPFNIMLIARTVEF